MGKKRGAKAIEEEEEKPDIWCFYCDREFDDEKVLLLHQKNKHFKCDYCSKKLSTCNGFLIHTSQVHKETVKSIPNAKPDRGSPDIDIFGMSGIPEEFIQQRNKLKYPHLEPPPPPPMPTTTMPTSSSSSYPQMPMQPPPMYPPPMYNMPFPGSMPPPQPMMQMPTPQQLYPPYQPTGQPFNPAAGYPGMPLQPPPAFLAPPPGRSYPNISTPYIIYSTLIVSIHIPQLRSVSHHLRA